MERESAAIYTWKHQHRSIPRVGFEPTIPLFEQAKTLRATDSTATVIGIKYT
jgi:hypothetical protein